MRKTKSGEDCLKEAENIGYSLDSPAIQAAVFEESSLRNRDSGSRDAEIRNLYAARALYKSCGNRRSEAETLLLLVNIYSLQGDHQKAVELIDSVIALLREDFDIDRLVRAYERKGFVLFMKRSGEERGYDGIIEGLKKISDAAVEPSRKAGTILKLIKVMDYASRSDEEKLALLKQAEALYGGIGDRKGEIRCQMQAIIPLCRLKRYEEAQQTLQRSLTGLQAMEKPDRYDDIYFYNECSPGRIYRTMGQVFRSQGRMAESLESFRKSLEYNIGEHLTADAVDDYLEILGIAISMYDIETALSSMKSAIELIPELHSPVLEAQNYSFLMRILFQSAHGGNLFGGEKVDLEDSLAYLLMQKILKDRELYRMMKSGLEGWIEYAVKTRFISSEVNARRDYARFLLIYGNSADAEKELKLAARLAEKLQDYHLEGLVLSDLADMLILHEKYAEASQILGEEIGAFRRAGREDFLQMALFTMGKVQEKMNKPEEARKYFQEAGAIPAAPGAKDLRRQALDLWHEKHDPDGALVLLKKALDEKMKNGQTKEVGWTLEDMAEICQEKGEYEGAFKNYGAAMEICSESRDLYRLESIALRLGAALEKRQKSAEAAGVYMDTLDTITSQWQFMLKSLGRRKLSGESATMKLFERLINVLLASERFEEALKYIELSSSLDLINRIKVDEMKLPDSEMKKLLDHLQTLREKMYLVNNELDTTPGGQRKDDLSQILASTRADFFATLNGIKSRNPDFEQLLNVRASDLAALQSIIPPGALLVEYYPSKDSLYIFKITSSSFLIKKVDIEREKLYESIRALRDRVTGRMELDRERSALYDLLVKPIEDSREESVIIVPGGLLWYLPFEILGSRSGEYLLEKKRISYLSSANVLSMVQQKKGDRASAMSLLAVGAPPGEDLPCTQKEISGILSIFPESKILEGKSATRVNFLKEVPGRNLIHIASHSALNRENINDSFIQLAEGRLYLGEIYGIPLEPSSLVILSSCESMLGEENPGGEFASLASAFTTAGATSVIASEWKVQDEATCRLFVEFYRNLKAGKSKAEALRLAKMSLLGNPASSHPFYWGGFVLMGEWR